VASLADIRAGLAANLSTIKGVQISAYQMANPTPPCLQVMGPSEADGVVFDRAFAHGHHNWNIEVLALVALTSDIGSQVLLDEMIETTGASSVKEAIETDPTLGGACQTLDVTTLGGYSPYTIEGRGPMIGARWNVLVRG
jgi:hypothetical protein